MDTELTPKCCAFAVGCDRGERYEVTFFDPSSNGRMIFGWFERLEDANRCCKGITKHPSWRDPKIRDRQQAISGDLKNPNGEDLELTIAGLRKEIEDLKTRVITWIPVAERLPETLDDYLLFDPVYGVEIVHLENLHRMDIFKRSESNLWAELPAGPEEGK